MDIGILTAGAAAFVAFVWGRGEWLRHILLLSWIAVSLEALAGVNMATVVFTMASLDLLIAGAALIIATDDPRRKDARIVGGISMALMPAHWIMAITHGQPNWTMYAIGCNVGFVIQCLIVRGWLDGVGRSIGSFFARVRPVFAIRRGD